jgi:hypothetical protein
MSDANPLLDGRLSLMVGAVQYAGKSIKITDCQDAAPGGDASLAFTLYGSLADDPFTFATNHPELVFDTPVVLTHNGNPIFTGQICSDPSVGVAGATAYVDVECDGLTGKAKRRDDYVHIWSDQSYEGWTAHRQTPTAFSVDTDGRILISLPKGISSDDYPLLPGAYVYYYPFMGLASPPLSFAIFDWDADLGWNADVGYTPADEYQWRATLAYYTGYSDSPADFAETGFYVYGKMGGGHQSGHYAVAFPTGAALLAFHLRPPVGIVEDSERYLQISNLTVGTGQATGGLAYVYDANPCLIRTTLPHGLTSGSVSVILSDVPSHVVINGLYTATIVSADTFTIPVDTTGGGGLGATSGHYTFLRGNTVSELMNAVATPTDNSLATTSDMGGADVLTECIIRTPMTRADAIVQIATQAPVQYDWRFVGRLFYCHPMPTDPATIRALATCYLIDATTPGITYDVHHDLESEPEFVRVLYSSLGVAPFPDGTVLTLMRPYDPGYESDACARVLVVDYSGNSMTTAQAATVGDQALAWWSVATGTITIATPTVPKEVGGTQTAAYIRAGDWIEESHVKALDPDRSLMYVTNRALDVDSGVVTLAIGGRGADFTPVLPSTKPLFTLPASVGSDAAAPRGKGRPYADLTMTAPQPRRPGRIGPPG